MSEADGSVSTYVYRFDQDTARLSVSAQGHVNNFEISNKEIVDAKNGSIFWSYPMGKMTVRFIGDAESKTPFKLHLKKTSHIYPKIHLFRKLDDKEIPIEKKHGDEEVILNSDSNNQCIIKVVGPNSLVYYGVDIDYSIEK